MTAWSRPRCIQWIVAAAAFVGLTPTDAMAQKRVVTHDDVWLLQRIGVPALSPDGRLAVFSVMDAAYDSTETVSDLWSVPTDGSAPPRRLTSSKAPEAGLAFSPDGRTIAFTTKRDGDEADQVYLLPIDGGEARRLTTLPSGASSPRFRPDGKAILVQTMLRAGAGTIDEHRKRAAEARARRDSTRAFDALPVRFWNYYIDEVEPALVVQPVDGGSPTVVPIAPLRGALNPEGPGENLNAVWTPDGAAIVFQGVANRHRMMTEDSDGALYAVDAAGGAPRRLTPRGATFSNPEFSPDGQSLFALESRDSSPKQIYFVNRLARLTGPRWDTVTILTDGWDRSVGAVTVSADGRSLYLEAQDQGALKIFRLPASGGTPEVVFAPVSGAVADLAAAGATIVGRYTSSTDPGQIARLDVVTKSSTTITAFNQERLAQLSLPSPEHFWFTAANGKRIHSIVVPPPVVEPGRRYPVVVMPHGGPNAMSSDSFSLRWNYHLLTSPGYYLIATNYTGSTGFGEAFTNDIERDVLRGPGQEILEAVAAAAKTYPQMDLARQAAVGASYGGYLMNWLNGTTTQFKALVNHAGAVNNESQYGVNDGGIGRELRMGVPIWDTGKGQWFDQSPIRYARQWKTPMLITQGELDYRVPFGESLTTFKLLQRLNVPSRFVMFPDEGHWIQKGPNSRRHMEEVLGWLARHLATPSTASAP